jgi:hypothetical protein
MRNKLIVATLSVCAALAQGPEAALDPRAAFKVNLPADGPLALVSADWGQSKATVRGGAVLVDLRSTLQLRNASPRRLRGVSLLVLAQEVTPAGKASVTAPSLDVEPGENFPVRIDLRLMRPLQQGSGALVEVGLDGALFEDLTFYGPDRLNSRRALLAWEMEARRDRRALLAALESGGAEALRKEMLTILARQADQPRLEMQLARGRATAFDPDRAAELAFVRAPEAPVEFVNGAVGLAGNEAQSPRIVVRNAGRKAVRFIEIGLVARDAQGRDLAAGSLPASLNLAPGQQGTVVREGALKFSEPGGAPAALTGLTGYLRLAEYSDGEMWVPSRAALRDPRLAAAGVSGEEQRLAELYRRKGLDAVVQQLRRMR